MALICRVITTAPPSTETTLLLQRIIDACKSLNPSLKGYVRETGVLRSEAVARNYLSYCHWLGLLTVDAPYVLPNGYTVVYGNINPWRDFELSPAEKIGFFLRVMQMVEVKKQVSRLLPVNRVRQHTLETSEHFVESFFEWFVDLGLVKPSAKRFGYFVITPLGLEAKNTVESRQFLDLAVCRFASGTLGTNVRSKDDLSDRDLISLVRGSLAHLGQFTGSELDPTLHSAFPIILDAQLRCIVTLSRYIDIKEFVERLTNLASKGKILFNWDSAGSRGYLKLVK